MSIMTVIATAPAIEPVTVIEAKAALRIDTTDHDTMIGNLIKAARRHLENICRFRFITQTCDCFLDDFPGEDEIELPYMPLISITGVYYTPDGGSELTFAAANYLVNTASEPGKIVLQSTSTWPSDTLTEAKGVRIRFVCGFGETTISVPEEIRQAIILMVSQWYDNPANYEVGPVMQTPFAVDALMANYRW
jgi:uncharacterized phiE125 gp8 family phage protein